MDQATGPVGLLAGMGLLQKVLVGVSCAVMACGVGLGVTGALEGGKGQASQADQATAADASGSAADTAGRVGGPEDGVSSLTGDGGWPLPLPTPPGGPTGSPDDDDPVPTDGGGGEDGASGQGGGADPWSPAIFRMGFSFFVGFAVAYAVRAFVKVSLIGLGLMFLLLFGLQYAGFIEVRWDVVGDRYDSTSAWLGGQVRSFQDFATGYLPSGGAALAGLAFGFKRK